MTCRMRWTNQSGHSTLEYDPTIESEVASASGTFEQLTGEGRVPFMMKDAQGGDVRERTETFDPNAQDWLFLSPIAGG